MNPSLNLESVYPSYFETFEVPVVRGRSFAASDRAGALAVAIVSDDLASRMWRDENPIGKRLKMGSPDSDDPWWEIVGVVGRTRYREVKSPPATLYVPAAQLQTAATMLALRTTAPLDLVASLVRDRVRAADSGVHVMRVTPFAEMLDRHLARPQFNAFLLTLFGISALLLSAVGLYAVIAAYVRQRGREIAIRRALGATTTGVRRFVLSETMRLAGLGSLVGLAGAVSATEFLRGMLFEIDPLDPLTLIATVALLVGTSLLASFVPLYRAGRLNVVARLQSE
jgi:hypothetical protein